MQLEGDEIALIVNANVTQVRTAILSASFCFLSVIREREPFLIAENPIHAARRFALR